MLPSTWAFTGLLAAVLVVCTLGNPFSGTKYYVNPSFQAEIDSSIRTCTDPVVNATLKQMRNVASAYWVDVMAKIQGNTTKTVSGILADAASKRPPELVVFIVYDLPNRDCHAKVGAPSTFPVSRPSAAALGT